MYYLANVQDRILLTHRAQLAAEQRNSLRNSVQRDPVVIFMTPCNIIKGEVFTNSMLGSPY